jgi:hypothetical protein
MPNLSTALSSQKADAAWFHSATSGAGEYLLNVVRAEKTIGRMAVHRRVCRGVREGANGTRHVRASSSERERRA